MSEVRIERRRMPRYPVRLSVETEQGEGLTRDISASGVYFETAELYLAGSPIRFTLVLEYAGPAPIRLSCVGEVLRVEPLGDSFGVAASITSHRIKSSSL
jgi:PilZ domain-containing protein